MLKQSDFEKIKFTAYNRKSSEQDERQALSIESQIEEVKRMGIDYGINLNNEDMRSEAKSAKNHGTRPAFEQMIQDAEKGKIQGIISWHADRLSRNPIDAARLVELIVRGKIKFIITRSQVYSQEPMSKFLLVMACGQAKMENDNKGINVMRGLAKKRRMGYLPGVAKVGYMNDNGEKGFRKILPDPDRYDLVKQVFDLYLTNKYTAGHLYKIAVDKIGLTTRQRKREGGVPVKKSQFYQMLKDPFYAGFFFGKDDAGEIVRYEVNAEIPRMISERDHQRILSILSRGGSRRSWIYIEDFPYKKACICGDCGGSVTAERKIQLICGKCKHKFSLPNKTHCPKCHTSVDDETNKLLEYIYYHCCKKKDPDCPGSSVSEKEITRAIKTEIIDQIAISEALKKWCLNSIVELEQREERSGKDIHENWYKKLEELESQDARAVEGYSKGLISDKELSQIRAGVRDQTSSIKAKIGLSEDTRLDVQDLSSKLDILTEIERILEDGTFEEKVEALSIIGSNLSIKSKEISVTKDILYESLQKGLMEAKMKNPQFEPKNIQDTSSRNEVFQDVSPTLLPRQDSNLRPIDYINPKITNRDGLYHHLVQLLEFRCKALRASNCDELLQLRIVSEPSEN